MKSKNSHRNDGVRTRRVKNLEELHEKMFVEQKSVDDSTQSRPYTQNVEIVRKTLKNTVKLD